MKIVAMMMVMQTLMKWEITISNVHDNVNVDNDDEKDKEWK